MLVAQVLLVGKRLGGLLPVVGSDQGDALAGAGPVAELQLGGVPAGQRDGVVAKVLQPLLGVAGHLEIHARRTDRAEGIESRRLRR